MINDVEQMFKYCEISEDGQQYFLKIQYENQKIMLAAFKHNLLWLNIFTYQCWLWNLCLTQKIIKEYIII